MSQTDIFDSETVVPDAGLAQRAGTLLGFLERYARVHDQLRLLLAADKLGDWSRRHHRRQLVITDLVADQYPLVVFHGDVGTGKTAMAECVANRLLTEARSEDATIFRLSNRVRGSGKVGEMTTLLAEALTRSSCIAEVIHPQLHGDHDALHDALYQAELFRLIRSGQSRIGPAL